jgi:hypothetical protein
MQKATLIIAGMHRSGTSLISNWLNKCGFHLGETLMGAAPSNEEGHFEDLEFLKLHEEILKDNDLLHTGLVDQHPIPVSMYHKEKIRGVIHVKNKLHKQWGWKEPRTCLFLDTYKELLPDAKYLVIIRDYPSVVSSLLKRDFKDIEKKYLSRKLVSRLIWKNIRRERKMRKFYIKQSAYFLNVWITYNQELLKLIESSPAETCLVINYNVLQKNDRLVSAYLKEKWHLVLKDIPFEEVFRGNLISSPMDIGSFISDKALIAEADDLQSELESHITKL